MIIQCYPEKRNVATKNKHIVSNEKKFQIDYSEQETLMHPKQGRARKEYHLLK